MNFLGAILLAQLAAPARPTPTQTLPLLAFPEPGLDDSAAYQGYQTRFFRDAARNTLQIYLDGREARVVHLWADAENESIGFTAREAGGRPAPLRWEGTGATVSRAGRTRTLEYRLATDAPELHVGWFLLGSMRVERDFQYWGRHRAPFAGPPFALEEMDRLLGALGRLDPAARRQHLALLGAADTSVLRARLRPTITTRGSATAWVARVVQPSLDARDTMVVELRVDPRRVEAAHAGDSVSLRPRPAAGGGGPLTVAVRVSTTGRALTPLARAEIFTPEFLRFVAEARRAGQLPGAADSVRVRARWLERQVRGVELLSSREKLMAGLPTYATYFGRDMLVSALMMRPIWRDEMSEFAVASALRKLAPGGEVSHEEALGGQAVREAAAEYASLVDAHQRAAAGGNRAQADSLLRRAGAVLRGMRTVRENYHMVDDELQLPVLAARWLDDPGVPAARKRAFLRDASDGGGTTRLARLVRELALVSRMTASYAADPAPANLIAFPEDRPGQYGARSWRDSRVGYANGRYAMDVNAIWAPHALESIGRILGALRRLGISPDSLTALVPELTADTPLGRYARDSLALRRAADTWWGASRHFLVRLSAADVRARVAARLAALPEAERDHWTRVLAATRADQDSLVFLALALDAQGQPVGVANSDPATRLFLGAESGQLGPGDPARIREDVLRDVRLFARAYPVGLFIDGVGPVVAADAYATPAVWQEFEKDRYHSPRVAWGREVNLFLLGAAAQAAAASRDPAQPAYAGELRDAMRRVIAAVEASGFQSELWSYEFQGGRPVAVRYGSGSDVQLWSTTDLAVQFAIWKLGK